MAKKETIKQRKKNIKNSYDYILEDDPLKIEKEDAISAMWDLWAYYTVPARLEMGKRIAKAKTSNEISRLLREVRDKM